MPLAITETTLIDGDALTQFASDILVQQGIIDVGEAIPTGWTVLTGNDKHSLVTRVIYRGDLEAG